MDAAADSCEEKNGPCQRTDMLVWWDETGLKRAPVIVEARGKSCEPPRGRVVKSTYSCSNGDCTRTFENGCSVKFQATRCMNMFTGNWEWKPDGC